MAAIGSRVPPHGPECWQCAPRYCRLCGERKGVWEPTPFGTRWNYQTCPNQHSILAWIRRWL